MFAPCFACFAIITWPWAICPKTRKVTKKWANCIRNRTKTKYYYTHNSLLWAICHSCWLWQICFLSICTNNFLSIKSLIVFVRLHARPSLCAKIFCRNSCNRKSEFKFLLCLRIPHSCFRRRSDTNYRGGLWIIILQFTFTFRFAKRGASTALFLRA